MKTFIKSAVSAILISFLFISCGDLLTQKNTSKADECNLTLVFDSQAKYLEIQNVARTASPEKSKSYKDVKNWTITFESESGDFKKVFENQTTNEGSEITFSVPVGLTYTITVEGSVEDNGNQLKYTGKTSGITVNGSTSVNCNIYVELEKTVGGKGSINFSCDVPEEFNDSDFELEI